MTDHATQLKIQARLDGELSPPEARELDSLLANNPDARALSAELEQTNRAFQEFGRELRLPESREFFWSKIERTLTVKPVPQPVRASAFAAWRRFMLPSGAFAAVVVAGLLATRNQPSGQETESVLTDSGAFTYRDFNNRTTLVWLSYPAEKELAVNDASDTIDD